MGLFVREPNDMTPPLDFYHMAYISRVVYSWLLKLNDLEKRAFGHMFPWS